MKRYFVVLACVVAVFAGNDDTCPVNGLPVVTAPIGKIRGSFMSTRLGKKIYSFRGVRYAEPPTGQQRFQIAIPAADWSDVFDATEEGPACPAFTNYTISEDCLRLNVHTTKLPSRHNSVRRPVVVYFHPGAFYLFTGLSADWGPQYFLDKDVVLVTVNYRLASLGFLSTGDSKAPGNLGLKDQVVALRWIQRNIAAFGGDPDCVTISGNSAGGMSVFLHMVSPMSKGLFHRVIMASGSQTSEPFPHDQAHLARKQAELLGCPTDTTGAMLVCMISKPVENFTNTLDKFFEWYGDPVLVWSPVVEPEVQGVERFLPDQPSELIKQGKFHKVPVMIGITKDEFATVANLVYSQNASDQATVINQLNNDWYRIAPISFLYERDTERSRRISTSLYQFYFGKKIDENSYDGIAHIYSDALVIFPLHESTKVLAANSDLPVYSYIFSYKGKRSIYGENGTEVKGILHSDDMQYVFYMSTYFSLMTNDDPDIPMVELMTSIWSHFAHTGQPISPALADITWEPYKVEKDNYLEITTIPTMKTGIYPDRMRTWESLFPQNYTEPKA